MVWLALGSMVHMLGMPSFFSPVFFLSTIF